MNVRDNGFSFQPWLDRLREQQPAMQNLLFEWASINSGTLNLSGVSRMQELAAVEFRDCSDSVRQIDTAQTQQVDADGDVRSVPLGPVMHASRRESAETQVLLVIHIDTVYGPDSPFQSVTQLDENTWRGPGVADAKGGLVVMLFALRAFEAYVAATGNDRVGWNVLVNSDEEIGSPGSADILSQFAARSEIGLLFEPSLPDGGLISTRKGSGNFSIVVRGKSAHAGREFEQGRNAVIAAAQIAAGLHKANARWPDVTINVSRIDGGSPVNMVPDVAVVRFNVRYGSRDLETEILQTVRAVLDDADRREGISCELHGAFTAQPKQMTDELRQLQQEISECGQLLGTELNWTASGGVCDGNRLAACGLPNVDTLGVRGGDIHSPTEYVLLDSLAERACLTALLLMRLAERNGTDSEIHL